tara:strand:- start:693 stop:926 length:234 start_codon:yes stop_codon:yes gene_type:complete
LNDKSANFPSKRLRKITSSKNIAKQKKYKSKNNGKNLYNLDFIHIFIISKVVTIKNRTTKAGLVKKLITKIRKIKIR